MKKSGKLGKLLVLFIALASCKANKVEVKNPQQVSLESQCVLSALPKTINYENEIEALSKDHKRKMIEIEALELDSVRYSTILNLKESSQYLWLIKNNTDSILIQCIDSTRSVESVFDMDNCEIEIMETEFFSNGDPKVSRSKVIKL